MSSNPSLRERKRRATRQAISDAALKLFLERGYEAVTVAEIADAANVSVGTLFSYVPDGKEALIFDDGQQRQAALVAAVTTRASGVPVLAALRAFLIQRVTFASELSPELQARLDLVVRTPALRGYQRKLWIRSEAALVAAIAADSGDDISDPKIRALARCVLEIPDIVAEDPDPRTSLDAVFDLLDHGWKTTARSPHFSTLGPASPRSRETDVGAAPLRGSN